MRVAAAVAAALLGVFSWRNARVLKNLFLPPVSLPDEYFINGDAKSQCSLIVDKISHKLSFCEDVIHWSVPVSRGKTARRLLVSCDPSRKQWNTVMGPLADPNFRGALWVYAPEEKKQLVEVAFDGYPDDADFHPLGIDVFPGTSSSDASHVLVVNHGRHNTTVEQFLLSPIAPYRATYVRTLTSPAFVSPNSVIFTSLSSFYVTQDHRFTRRLPGIMGHTLPLLETILLPGLAWIDHVKVAEDGKLNITRAAQGIPFANGISISPNGGKVAVASSSQGAIHLYSRTDGDELRFDESVLVPFAPDNIGYEVDGSLSVAGHPHFPALASVAASKREYAPSWAVSIIPRIVPFNANVTHTEDRAPYPVTHRAPISSTYEIKTLYQSNGYAFSGSTTALWDSSLRLLYVVGLYQEGILRCQG